ncbi:MAG: universal stress protein [Bdellovibrionales bacterium]|nr:universal stress protein [Bdellovibrionales bacterium]
MAKSKKVMWALDPFVKSTKRVQQAAGNVKAIASAMGAEIEPVYILSPEGFNFTGDFSSGWIKDFKPKAIEKMKRVLSKLDVETLPPKIIVNQTLSLTGDSKKLINYAKRHGAAAVLLSTHARSGIARFVMGSFSETTLLQTKVPLILVNPEAPAITQLKTILFATDGSADSKIAFQRLLKTAKSARAKVVLYHKLPDPIEPIVQTGVHIAGGGWVSVQQFLSKEQKQMKKKLDGWAAIAKKSGVATRVVIDETPGFITDSILEQAKVSKADMVAVLSKSSRISSILIGSVGRQLARQSHRPVFLLHKDPN